MSAGASARRPPGESWRIRLPTGVRSPFEVYINGVRQELGRDYRIEQGELVFGRELVKHKTSLWAWFLGAWGIGTYKRNDEIDIRYSLDGRTMVKQVTEVIPPSARPPA
jgi:hypothetical protein